MAEVKKNNGLAAYRARVVREKRGLLMDAATALFLSQGYAHTSLEEVARLAKVSSATLYKHFPTKAALFGGIMARLWENDEDTGRPLPPPGDPRAALLAIGRDYADLLSRRQTVDLFRVVTAEAPRFPELGQKLYSRGKKPYLDRLDDYLAEEIAGGSLRIDDLSLATRQFLGMINDVVFWPRLLIVDLQVTAEETDRVVTSAVETFMARYGAVR